MWCYCQILFEVNKYWCSFTRSILYEKMCFMTKCNQLEINFFFLCVQCIVLFLYCIFRALYLFMYLMFIIGAVNDKIIRFLKQKKKEKTLQNIAFSDNSCGYFYSCLNANDLIIELTQEVEKFLSA